MDIFFHIFFMTAKTYGVVWLICLLYWFLWFIRTLLGDSILGLEKFVWAVYHSFRIWLLLYKQWIRMFLWTNANIFQAEIRIKKLFFVSCIYILFILNWYVGFIIRLVCVGNLFIFCIWVDILITVGSSFIRPLSLKAIPFIRPLFHCKRRLLFLSLQHIFSMSYRWLCNF